MYLCSAELNIFPSNDFGSVTFTDQSFSLSSEEQAESLALHPAELQQCVHGFTPTLTGGAEAGRALTEDTAVRFYTTLKIRLH